MITATIARTLADRKGEDTIVQLPDILQQIEAAALRRESSLIVQTRATPETMRVLERAGFSVTDQDTQLRIDW